MQEMLLARLYSSNGTNEKISLIELGIWDFPWNYGNTFFSGCSQLRFIRLYES